MPTTLKDITVLVNAMSHPGKMHWLKQSCLSIDKYFNTNKILSVDQFHEHRLSDADLKYFMDRGWKVLKERFKNRANSIKSALSHVKTEWVFFSEDDVVIDFESYFYSIIKNLDLELNLKDKQRKMSMLSLALGGTNIKPPNEYGDLINASEKRMNREKEFLIFYREEKKKNLYFFDFPTVFVRKEIFEKSLIRAMKDFKNEQLERALSRCYFLNSYHKYYFKASVCKPNMVDVLKTSVKDMNSKCRFITTLDPEQGNFRYGGRTSI